MIPFLQQNFAGRSVETDSWDDITEAKRKGVANPKYNIVYVFMQHEFNKYIEWYTYSKGTMLDALANPTKKNWPPNSPQNPIERKKWIEEHMANAGFLNELNQPYDKNKLFQLLNKMEHSVYPPGQPGQQEPNTSTYFGKMQMQIENERNQTIYDLMKQGGCCFAGSGHLVELKQQFPNLELIGNP